MTKESIIVVKWWPPTQYSSPPPKLMPYNEIAERRAHRALETSSAKDAITILMTSYGDEIFHFCRSMLNNSADAQDTLQTTFIQAFKGLERFQHNSTYRTWLYAIARNRCLDLIKRNRRLSLRVEFTDELPETHAKTETSSQDKDPRVGKILRKCLSKLSSNVRSAILLRFQSELSYEEAAKLSDNKAGTLQARVARAMPTLRQCVEEHGVSL